MKTKEDCSQIFFIFIFSVYLNGFFKFICVNIMNKMRQIFGRAAILAMFAQSFLPSFTAVYAAELEASLGDSVATPALVE